MTHGNKILLNDTRKYKLICGNKKRLVQGNQKRIINRTK